jgi:hypothetical protein
MFLKMSQKYWDNLSRKGNMSSSKIKNSCWRVGVLTFVSSYWSDSSQSRLFEPHSTTMTYRHFFYIKLSQHYLNVTKLVCSGGHLNHQFGEKKISVKLQYETCLEININNCFSFRPTLFTFRTGQTEKSCNVFIMVKKEFYKWRRECL